MRKLNSVEANEWIVGNDVKNTMGVWGIKGNDLYDEVYYTQLENGKFWSLMGNEDVLVDTAQEVRDWLRVRLFSLDILADDALSAACYEIQKALEVTDGFRASIFFSDNKIEQQFITYALQELEEKDPMETVMALKLKDNFINIYIDEDLVLDLNIFTTTYNVLNTIGKDFSLTTSQIRELQQFWLDSIATAKMDLPPPAKLCLGTEVFLCKVKEDLNCIIEKGLWDGSELHEACVQLGWINCLMNYGLEPKKDDIAEIREFHDSVLHELNKAFELEDRR